jgi:phosphoribosylanthranilate isomerase
VTAASLCRTRVKICCIGSIAEAEMAVRHGASAIGLVSEMPSGPGVIDEALIAEIAARVPAGVATFLLTSRVDPGAIVEQHRRCRTSAIQICDQLPPGAYARLRDALPGIALVQVIHVRGEESVREALDAAPHVNALLLDSGNPSLAVKELGGTGRTHDWRSSRAIVESSPVAVYLAGGLNASNVGEAIRQVRPFGVDLCSGIRVDGKLSEEKLAAFCRAVAET